MNTELFRSQVLQREGHRQEGRGLIHQPPGLRALTLLFAGLFLALLTFAASAQISRTEVVRGHLSMDSGVARVYAPRPGLVRQLLVGEGEWVEEGALLMTLEVSGADAAGKHAYSFVSEQLAQQRQALERRLRVLQQQEESGSLQLSERIAAMEREQATRARQGLVLDERVAIAAAQLLRSQQLLARRAIAPAAHAQVQESHALVQQQALAHTLDVQELELALLTLQHEQRQLTLEIQNERLQLDAALAQLTVQRLDRELQQSFGITAPVAGRVGALLVQSGMQVEPGRPVLSLLPQDSSLVAQMFVPSRAVGRLQAGQAVLLSYDAFPVNVFGSFPATVRRVSAATIDPREFLLPFDAGEPVYLVEAALLDADTGSAAPLRAGMQFTAQIVTGRQTLLSRITAPLRALERRL